MDPLMPLVLAVFIAFGRVDFSSAATETPYCYGGMGDHQFDVSFGTCHQRSPRSANEICTTMTLISAETREKGGVDVANLSNPPYNASRDLKVLIPGFTNDDLCEKWEELQNVLLDEDNNVIMVDWSRAANLSDYVQARADARVVGLQVAKVLDDIHMYTNREASFDRMHLIGGGLGAHVAGYAGRDAREPVGRITGLDPAATDFASTEAQCRLDISDATFVDAIHTNAGGGGSEGFAGIMEEVGHQDFYPNGGQDQPGCDGDERCNHARALEFFTESVPKADYGKFASERKADNPEDFEEEGDLECSPNDICPEMGYWAEKIKGNGNSYFLTTNAESPYSMEISSDAAPPA